MMKRLIPTVAIGLIFSVVSMAETIRPQYTKENRFPELGNWEVIGLVQAGEFVDDGGQYGVGDGNFWSVEAGGRYQATENLALLVEVPFGGISPDEGSNETSIGDIAVGLQLKAHEAFFRFPYIIPHAKYAFDTGSEKAGTGDGDGGAILGVTVGSRVYDIPVYVNFDINYELRPDSDNIFGLAASVVWEINERFSVLAEVLGTDEDVYLQGGDQPTYYEGAMNYHPSERMTIGVYVGSAKNSPRDVFSTLRVAYDL
jgi:hypothetical protein